MMTRVRPNLEPSQFALLHKNGWIEHATVEDRREHGYQLTRAAVKVLAASAQDAALDHNARYAMPKALREGAAVLVLESKDLVDEIERQIGLK